MALLSTFHFNHVRINAKFCLLSKDVRFEFYCQLDVFVLNITPTTKVIWGCNLQSCLTEQRIEPVTLGYCSVCFLDTDNVFSTLEVRPF